MAAKKILVIEDNELNMKLVRTLIVAAGHEALEAQDAEQGIKIAGELLPDLILMDIQLPGLDGLSATRILNKNPLTRDIPVVALTAFAMDSDKKQAREAGCEGYISKPINTRKFIEEIKSFFKTS